MKLTDPYTTPITIFDIGTGETVRGDHDREEDIDAIMKDFGLT